jgi:plastocyanin
VTRRARRASAGLLATAILGLVLPGCSRSQQAVVLVDNSHDAFAASMISFFPDHVVVRPGETVRFRQRWTGEPHSVTFGALFNDQLGRIRERLEEPLPPVAADLPDLAVINRLPVMLGRDGAEFVVNQNGAQPCFLDDGAPPLDPDEACPARRQPRFTGRHSYYSSGFIPYRGARGNRFDVTLSGDIAPGDYHFYCNLHGVGQSGTMTVVGAGEDRPPRSTVDRRTQERIAREYSSPLATALAAARRDDLRIDGVAYDAPLAGAATTEVRPWGGAAHRLHFGHRHGSVDEFLPGIVRATVGRPVTWTFVGRHTVSFNVPRYLPVFAVDDDGTVRLDRRVHEPVGWTVPAHPPDAPPRLVDAGVWNGEGFRSSGLDWRTGDRFRVTFSRPGSYLLACLIHPAMVGKVVVRDDA